MLTNNYETEKKGVRVPLSQGNKGQQGTRAPLHQIVESVAPDDEHREGHRQHE